MTDVTIVVAALDSLAIAVTGPDAPVIAVTIPDSPVIEVTGLGAPVIAVTVLDPPVIAVTMPETIAIEVVLGGAQGPTGPQGIQGAQGIQGVVGPAGTTDHGELTGVADDDHPQYHNNARGDARYFTQAQSTSNFEAKNAKIHRELVSTSGNVTMGNVEKTDYVYFVTGAHVVSLPAPNNNKYTVKNIFTASITVDTAGAELIEGVASILLGPESSVDIISNGVNWFVT